jgi:hypothetical protein
MPNSIGLQKLLLQGLNRYISLRSAAAEAEGGLRGRIFLLHVQKQARITRLNGRVIPGGGGFILIKAYPLLRLMAFFVSTSRTKASF